MYELPSLERIQPRLYLIHCLLLKVNSLEHSFVFLYLQSTYIYMNKCIHIIYKKKNLLVQDEEEIQAHEPKQFLHVQILLWEVPDSDYFLVFEL